MTENWTHQSIVRELQVVSEALTTANHWLGLASRDSFNQRSPGVERANIDWTLGMVNQALDSIVDIFPGCVHFSHGLTFPTTTTPTTSEESCEYHA